LCGRAERGHYSATLTQATQFGVHRTLLWASKGRFFTNAPWDGARPPVHLVAPNFHGCVIQIYYYAV